MTGKVISKDGKLFLLSHLGNLMVSPNNLDNTIKKLQEKINKNNFAWVEYVVETIGVDSDEFDIIDSDVAVIENIYNDDFGRLSEGVSVVTERSAKNKYPIGGYKPGYYTNKCKLCSHYFAGDKNTTQCEPCAIESLIKE
jgi:hypothetical protein